MIIFRWFMGISWRYNGDNLYIYVYPWIIGDYQVISSTFISSYWRDALVSNCHGSEWNPIIGIIHPRYPKLYPNFVFFPKSLDEPRCACKQFEALSGWHSKMGSKGWGDVELEGHVTVPETKKIHSATEFWVHKCNIQDLDQILGYSSMETGYAVHEPTIHHCR
jgi:hypothetical protein